MENAVDILEANAEELRSLGARRIGIFGSMARGEGRDGSDVDVYVELDDSRRTFDDFFALYDCLEELFGRRVDLVTDQSLTPTKVRLILPTVRYASVDPEVAVNEAPGLAGELRRLLS